MRQYRTVNRSLQTACEKGHPGAATASPARLRTRGGSGVAWREEVPRRGRMEHLVCSSPFEVGALILPGRLWGVRAAGTGSAALREITVDVRFRVGPRRCSEVALRHRRGGLGRPPRRDPRPGNLPLHPSPPGEGEGRRGGPQGGAPAPASPPASSASCLDRGEAQEQRHRPAEGSSAQEKPPEAEPKKDEPPAPEGVPGGVEGGVAGGVIGGVVGGTGSAASAHPRRGDERGPSIDRRRRRPRPSGVHPRGNAGQHRGR